MKKIFATLFIMIAVVFLHVATVTGEEKTKKDCSSIRNTGDIILTNDGKWDTLMSLVSQLQIDPAQKRKIEKEIKYLREADDKITEELNSANRGWYQCLYRQQVVQCILDGGRY